MQILNLEPERLQLSWISASEGKRYIEVVNQFSDKIKQLGPSPISQRSQI
jgi:F420-non-reducing hydrogenase iron-sulfur subunit